MQIDLLHHHLPRSPRSWLTGTYSTKPSLQAYCYLCKVLGITTNKLFRSIWRAPFISWKILLTALARRTITPHVIDHGLLLLPTDSSQSAQPSPLLLASKPLRLPVTAVTASLSSFLTQKSVMLESVTGLLPRTSASDRNGPLKLRLDM